MCKSRRQVSGAVVLALGLASCSHLCSTFVPASLSKPRNVGCIALKAEKEFTEKYKSGEVRIGILVGCGASEPNWLSDAANKKAADANSLSEMCEGISTCWKPGPMAAPDTTDFTLPAQVPMHAHLIKKALGLHGDNKIMWEETVDRVLQLPITAKLRAMKDPVDAILVVYRLGYDNANLIAKYTCVINGLQSVAFRLGVPIISHNLAEIKLSTINLESSIKRTGERIVKMGKMADPVVVSYEEA